MPRAYDPVGAMGGLFAPAHIYGDPESLAAVEAWTARQRAQAAPPPLPQSTQTSPLGTLQPVGAPQPFAGPMPAGALGDQFLEQSQRDAIALALMQQQYGSGGDVGGMDDGGTPSSIGPSAAQSSGPFSGINLDEPGNPYSSPDNEQSGPGVGGGLGGGGVGGGGGGPAGAVGGGFGSSSTGNDANTAAAQAAQEGMATGLSGVAPSGIGPTSYGVETGTFSSPGFGPEATAQATAVDNNPYSSVDANNPGYGTTHGNAMGVGVGTMGTVGATTDPGSYGPTGYGYGYGIDPGYDAMASMDAPDSMGGGFGEGPGDGGMGGSGSDGGMGTGGAAGGGGGMESAGQGEAGNSSNDGPSDGGDDW